MKLLKIFKNYLLEEEDIESTEPIKKLSPKDVFNKFLRLQGTERSNENPCAFKGGILSPISIFVDHDHVKDYILKNVKGRGTQEHLIRYNNFIDDIEENKRFIVDKIMSNEDPIGVEPVLIGRIEDGYIKKDNVTPTFLSGSRVFGILELDNKLRDDKGERCDQINNYRELESSINDILEYLNEYRSSINHSNLDNNLKKLIYKIENKNKNRLPRLINDIKSISSKQKEEKFLEDFKSMTRTILDWCFRRHTLGYKLITMYLDRPNYQHGIREKLQIFVNEKPESNDE